MNPIQRKRIALLALLLTALPLVTVGCFTSKGPKPVMWSVSLTKATTAPIKVELMGISAAEKSYWENSVKPSEYWAENSAVRKGAEKRIVAANFEVGATWVLSRTNSIWKEWFSYGATDLMIMARLPGGGDDTPNDPRRRFFSLDKKAWVAKNNQLEFEILDRQIRPLTPPSVAK